MINKVYIVHPKLPPEKTLSGLSDHIQANIMKALTDGMKLAETTSQTKYLSGPRPVKLRTDRGLLRSSVKSAVMKGGGEGIFATGFLRAGMAGEAVEYARIHEYGGLIKHPGVVNKLMRFTDTLRNNPDATGELVFTRRTRPHYINMPARPYLRPAMDETFPIIENMIQAAIDRAFRSKE